MFVLILVVAGGYGYNTYSELYSSNVADIRYSSARGLKSAVWGEYKENMDKLDKIFAVEIRYVKWDKLVSFERNLGTNRPVSVFFDSDSKMVWVQDTFPGSMIRVTVYEHLSVDNFATWVNAWIDTI